MATDVNRVRKPNGELESFTSFASNFCSLSSFILRWMDKLGVKKNQVKIFNPFAFQFSGKVMAQCEVLGLRSFVAKCIVLVVP